MRRLILSLVAVLVAATACTSAQPGTGQPGPAVVSAHAQDPVALIAQAQQGLEEVLAYEARGTLVLAGQEITVDLVVQYSSGHGSVTARGITFVIDLVPSFIAPAGSSGLFITAPAQYWKNQGLSPADAARYAGRQVSVPEASPLASGALLLGQKTLTQLIFATAGTVSSPHVLATPPVDGQPAWIVDYGGEHTTRLTMMQNAQQFPLRLVSPHVTMTFGQFGKEAHVSSPSGTPLSLPG